MDDQSKQDRPQAIGYRTPDGRLHQWLTADCTAYDLATIGTVYLQNGVCVLHSFGLADVIDHERAAELLLGSGHQLPSELLHVVEGQADDA